MSGDGSDAEAVAGVGAFEDKLVGPPEPDGLVKRTGEEERRAIGGCGCPCDCPH